LNNDETSLGFTPMKIHGSCKQAWK